MVENTDVKVTEKRCDGCYCIRPDLATDDEGNVYCYECIYGEPNTSEAE